MIEKDAGSGLYLPSHVVKDDKEKQIEQLSRAARRRRNKLIRKGLFNVEYTVCGNCKKGPQHGSYTLRNTKNGLRCQNCE